MKAIICSAVAAAQAAYYLSLAEYAIAEATNAVAIKARAAAVADTYANQGSRSGAILPFTSGDMSVVYGDRVDCTLILSLSI